MDTVDVFRYMGVGFFTLLGLVIGSFLNVCIYRVPEGRTVVKGHSMCMSCGHELGAADLVPLFSWLFLRGKCRYCKAPIASRYALIEGLTAATYGILAWPCRWYFYPPVTIAPENLPPILMLLLTLATGSLLIVAMMIRKDKNTLYFRFPVTMFVIVAAQTVFLAVLGAAPVKILVFEGKGAGIAAAAVLVGVAVRILVSFQESGSAGVGECVRRYFSRVDRGVAAQDLLCIAVGAFLGYPLAILPSALYLLVRVSDAKRSGYRYGGILLFVGVLAATIYSTAAFFVSP